jgi:phosphoglycerate dehydrogenase-like enzyme
MSQWRARNAWRKTVGIIGLGRLASIGSGWRASIAGSSPTASGHEFARLHRVSWAAGPGLGHADFVGLNCHSLPSARIVDRNSGSHETRCICEYGRRSRGRALFEALHSGHLRGAALDAFSIEPPDPNHPLLSLPQVLATPHLGAQTDGATNNMGWMALRDCLAVLRGDEPLHRVA